MMSFAIAAIATLLVGCLESYDDFSYDGPPRCGLAADTGLDRIEVRASSRRREYTLSVPDGYDPSVPTALVFAWHGRDGTGLLAREIYGLEEEANGAAIFVYPNGLAVKTMGGQTGWDLRPDGYDLAFFDAMRSQIYSGFCIDEDRVFSAGHSFGGYMTNALGCFRPDVLRAIGSVSGGPPYAECEPGNVAGILMHGEVDEVVPFDQGIMARDELLARNRCESATMPVAPAPCVAHEGCETGYDVRWCEHDSPDAMGHALPDFAAGAIWSFFAGLAPE